MDYKVVYFTRTNNSKRIAEKIGKELSCQVIEIRDSVNWSGALGFVKGGYYASKDKEVEIELTQDLGSYDELIVVSPLWAGKVVPAVESFLKSVEKDKVHLVISAKSTGLRVTAGYKSVHEIIQTKNNEDQLIEELVKELKTL